MGNPSGLPNSVRAGAERQPAAAMFAAALPSNSLLDIAGIVSPLFANLAPKIPHKPGRGQLQRIDVPRVWAKHSVRWLLYGEDTAARYPFQHLYAAAGPPDLNLFGFHVRAQSETHQWFAG